MLLVKFFYRGVARSFQRRGGTNGGGGSRSVTPRALTSLVCPHPGRVLLQVTLFWMSSEIASWIKSVPRSIIYSILLANKEQEHGPPQTFGPANGVSNNLALEKIYCMLILRIRRFWPPEL